MRPEQRFFLFCGAVAGASLVLAVLPAPAILRTIVALPLVFVLPGAALLRALDLRFAPGAHAPIVVGISMAITVLSGIALNLLGGLTPLGWAVGLSAVTLLAAMAALRHVRSGPRLAFPAIKFSHGVMLTITAVILVVTVQNTLRFNAEYRPFPHTSFWMLPIVQDSNVYVIGIKNEEIRPETYVVQLLVDQRITGEWQNLILAPGQTLTYPVTIQAGVPAQAWLYRMEEPDTIYRRVTVAANPIVSGAPNVTSIADAANGGQ